MANDLVVAITGASGSPYGVRLLDVLLRDGRTVHLVISPAATQVMERELGVSIDLTHFDPMLLLKNTDVSKLHYHHFRDFSAGIASGSFRTAGMAVCPCSMGTVAAIAHGTSENLIHRAADVHLKERRKLILVPRETPLGLIQLRNLTAVAEAGAVVLPAMPAFYTLPKSVDDMIDFVVGRVCDQLGVEHRLFPRWGAEETMNRSLSADALAVWHAAVDAVRPGDLIPEHVRGDGRLRDAIANAKRILVVGAGKAGAAMAEALETALGDQVNKVTGIVNVPADAVRPLQRIVLHPARPPASNHPTADGVHGAEKMLALLGSARPDDIAICLLSGGGSALLPAPDGVSLEDKQAVTKLLHTCGATIHEMNAVRKHLSKVKGGRLAHAFRGKELFSLIVSDVVGDPLDVIASGPTAADPSTFADAMAVLDRYGLRAKVPAVVEHLERGIAGQVPETLKELPPDVHNVILGNNARALGATTLKAEALGYRVVNLGSFVEGETRQVATAVAGVVRSIRADGLPVSPPVCLLVGGETTVTLGPDSGKGGRNQEFVLAVLHQLGVDGMRGIAVLSGGTDGEDGPTDAAGAVADETTWEAIRRRELNVSAHLDRHDAYPLFDAVGGLIRTGLTHTNVMDVRVVLVS